MTDWQDGEEVMDEATAREIAKAARRDPKHKRPKGHPDDELTRDTPIDPDTEDE